MIVGLDDATAERQYVLVVQRKNIPATLVVGLGSTKRTFKMAGV